MDAALRPLDPLHRFSRALLRVYFGGICRIRLEDAVLPRSGFVISMNHRSALDMILYGAILPRRIKFLAKQELFRYPLIGWAVSRWCVPVARGHYDRRALDAGVRYLREGYVLSVFPEGTRHAQLAAGHGGAVLLASRAGVPVLPGAIIGSYGPFQKLTIRFGKPLSFPPGLTRDERRAGTEALMATIRTLGARPRGPRRLRKWREALRALRRKVPRRRGQRGGSERAG